VAITVVIADDDETIRVILRRLLGADYDVLGAVADGPSLVATVVERSPDVIITDVSMPGFNGLEALRQLQQRGITAKAIVVSADPDLAGAVVAAGALGFIHKPTLSAHLLKAVRAVLNGLTYYPRDS
jgi:DNA-binding NarL/FixJ family response regulator